MNLKENAKATKCLFKQIMLTLHEVYTRADVKAVHFTKAIEQNKIERIK